MEKKFTSDEVPLGQLLDQARSGALQLPDFQRGWVWDDSHIASLLASLSLSYPIGAVMTLQTGNPDVRFRPRPLEGVGHAGGADQQPDPGRGVRPTRLPRIRRKKRRASVRQMTEMSS